MAKLQLNGNLTILNSKILTPEERQLVLKASPNKNKALRLTLFDANGNKVILTGTLYESKNGSLTARFNVKVDNFDIVEVDAKHNKNQTTEECSNVVLKNLYNDLEL